LPLELAGFINPAFNKSLTMNIIHYKSVGFELVGKMVKDPAQGKKKHNVYVRYVDDFDPKKKKGVYIIANSLQVLKIGESENLTIDFNATRVILDLLTCLLESLWRI